MKKITLKKNGFIRFCFVLFLFSILISGLAFVHSVQATTATVSVFPSTVTASVGQNFSIDVNIANVFDLYGWEFKLSWNASLLDAVNAVEGPFLKAGGSTYFTYRLNATAGYLIADCTLLGMVPGVSGNGTLTTITFYVKNGGECPLDLYHLILLNSIEQPIPSLAVDGYGYFTPPHDVAVTDVSASPITVLPGDIVNINVTIQNQGSYAEVFNVTVYANSQVIGVQSVSLSSGSSTIITFAWNTTGFGKGDYTVSASASVVPGEVDTADNTKLADKVVTILYLGHDLAIIGVEPFKTVVGQGYSVYIAVTVKNYGVFSETFDTTVNANTTAIKTQPVTLASGDSAKLTFTWNTAGFAKGNYTISAYATPVFGEINEEDNRFVDSLVLVSCVGDVNGDKKTSIADIVLVIGKFGTTPASPDWNPNCDIDGNDKVTIGDIVITIGNFGNIWT